MNKNMAKEIKFNTEAREALNYIKLLRFHYLKYEQTQDSQNL